MKALALFVFNLRATRIRHVLAPLIIAGMPIALMAFARQDGKDALCEPILLALLGLLAAITPSTAIFFSPLEDFVLKGRPLRRSLPLSSLDFALACGAALLVPALLTVVFGLAGIWALCGRDLGGDGFLLAALFAFRMAVVGCLISLWGFWARIVWGERAWMKSGGALSPFFIFGGIVLSKSAWGTTFLLKCFLFLALPVLGWSDAVLFVLAGMSLTGTALVLGRNR